jgi:hypothetical protein
VRRSPSQVFSKKRIKKAQKAQNPQISYGLHIRGILVDMPLAEFEKYAVGSNEQLWQGPL